MKKNITAALAALFISGIALIIYYNYTMRTRNAIDKLIANKKIINILIAGHNNQHTTTFPFYGILSINPDNNNVGLTLIPPEFRVRLDNEGNKFGKISELEFNNFTKTQIKRTLEIDLKLNVLFYIELDAKNVSKVVNLIEGIELFILDQLKNEQGISFGLNYFDGKKILTYINRVNGNSIYMKYDRILDILLTLYSNKSKVKLFNNKQLIIEALKDIKTNLLPQELIRIGDTLANEGNFISTTLYGKLVDGFYIVDDIAYKIYKKEYLTPLVLHRAIVPKIKILNGTKIPRLARRFRNNLIRDGLNVIEFGTSPYQLMKKSIIISTKGNSSAAKKVSELTGIDKIYYIIDNTQLHNVLIILGEDQKK